MRKRKRVPMWAHPDFHRELKIQSAELGKPMEDITKDLAEEFRLKRKRNRGDYSFL